MLTEKTLNNNAEQQEPKLLEQYDSNWSEDGTAHADAPKWAQYKAMMASEFPSPFRAETDELAHQLNHFVEKIDRLRPEKGGPAYLGTKPALTYSYPEVKNITVGEKMSKIDDVIDDVIDLYQGVPNFGSPLSMFNVAPQPNTAAIIASMLGQVFPSNYLEEETAWNLARAELESAGMLANLLGWDPLKAGGIYTYGGAGCFNYGTKYGLTRVLPNVRNTGVRTDAKIICSQQAHYCQQTATDWLGLGMDNIVHVRTDDANEMDVDHLEEILKDLAAKKIPVATIICTMGTTDANAFDPIAKVRALLDRYPNPEGFGKAILYADAVCGWSWIYFKDYDFANNPLGFSDRVLPILKRNGQAMADLVHADAAGIDFHKLGFAPYVSSCLRPFTAAAATPISRRGAITTRCTIRSKCRGRRLGRWRGGRRSNISAKRACRPFSAASSRRNTICSTCSTASSTWSASTTKIPGSSRCSGSIPRALTRKRSTPRN
jgi:L-2,4-diaminobutyrate decarboxylase